MTAREALDQEMKQLLLELMLVSSGTTASYNATGGGEKDDPVPPGETLPPHDYWARRYDAQENDEDRRQVIDDARDDLKRLAGRYQRDTTGETPEQHRARLLQETEGWSPEDVERSAWRTSAQLVRKWRTMDGRWPDAGHRIEAEEAPADQDLAARAVQMKASGMSLRQIGMILGKDQKQVQRYLARAA